MGICGYLAGRTIDTILPYEINNNVHLQRDKYWSTALSDCDSGAGSVYIIEHFPIRIFKALLKGLSDMHKLTNCSISGKINVRFAGMIRDLEKIFRKLAKYTAPETLLMA